MKKLLIVILDGASDAGLKRADTPYLDAHCRSTGPQQATAPLPTITYGNHSCIITGRDPGGPRGHGIVGNLFRDPATGQIVNLDHAPLNDFLQAPTLFELLESDTGRPLRCATVAEPVTRGAVAVDPMMPYFELAPLERDTFAAEKVSRFINHEAPDVIVVNFLSVDAAGENHGPDSDEYMDILAQADTHIKTLVAEWEDVACGRVHLLVTSDHGMHKLERVVNAGEILAAAGVGASVAASHRAAHVYLESADQLDAAQKALHQSGAFAHVLTSARQAEIRVDHERSGDLFLLAAPGVELQKQGLLGSHGSDRAEETTAPLLVSGPEWEAVFGARARDMENPSLKHIVPLCRTLFSNPA